MKAYYYSLIMLLLLSGASCSGNTSQSEDAQQTEAQQDSEHNEHSEELELTQRQIDAVGITLGQIETKQMSNSLHVQGELEVNPQDQSEVSSLLGGIVRNIAVVEGQAVKAGQVVAYVENAEVIGLQRDYLIARQETELAEAELKRQETLVSHGAGIAKNLQQASASYQMALAKQTGLRQQLQQLGVSTSSLQAGRMSSLAAVRTTISGTVGRINISNGNYIDPTTPLMQIADNKAVYCHLRVFERDLGKVAVGQEVELVITSNPSQRLQGQIFKINRALDPTTKTLSVHARITQGISENLVVGMHTSGLIRTASQSYQALPDGAIVSSEGKKYIYALTSKDGDTLHFRPIEVTTGVSELGYTAITPLQALEDGLTLVTDKAFYLASMSADHGEH